MNNRNRNSAVTTKLRGSRRRGITLVEVAVASLLTGVVLVAALKTVGAVFQTRRANAVRLDGPNLAHDLVSEILQARYEDADETPVFGIEPGENQSPVNRNEFDDVDDYKGWSESPPAAKDGTPISGFTGWTRDVIVKKIDSTNPGVELADAAPDQGLKKVVVTVTDPQGKTTILAVMRSRWGAVEQPPAADSTIVTAVQARLQLGNNSKAAQSGTSIANHAQDH